MSHFTVMVIDSDGSRNLENHLQPYHEFECTGTRDKYVVPVLSEEYQIEEYFSETVTVIRVKETGEVRCNKYSDEANKYWNRSGIGISSGDKLELPPHLELADIPNEERYASYKEWLKDWCGIDLSDDDYFLKEGKLYRYTNPNAKWDWWVVGGRWSGFLTQTNGNKLDDATFGSIDWNSMLEEPKKSAGELFDRLANAIGLDDNGALNQPSPSWQELTKIHEGNIDAARDAYRADPVKEAFEAFRAEDKERRTFGFFCDVTDFQGTKEEYVQRKSEDNISTYAVLKDGQWFAKGEMGWFGISSDTDEEAREWATSFQDTFLKDLSDHARITIVDCHI